MLFSDGRCFVIFTNHKPLTFAFSKISFPWFAQQQRHLAAILEYATDICHIAKKQNFLTDTLPRPTTAFLQTSQINFNYQDISADQVVLEVQDCCTIITNLRLEDIWIKNSNVSLLCDVSTESLGQSFRFLKGNKFLMQFMGCLTRPFEP